MYDKKRLLLLKAENWWLGLMGLWMGRDYSCSFLFGGKDLLFKTRVCTA